MQFFSCDQAPLLYYIKHCASFQSHRWIQTGVTVWKRSIRVKICYFLSRVTLKFDGWPWKTIGHLFYVTSSRQMLGRRHNLHWRNVSKWRWANMALSISATLAQHCNTSNYDIVPTFCQHNNLLHFIIFDGWYYIGTMYYEWLAKRWHNFIIAHCLSTIMIKKTSFIWKAVA